MKLLNLKSKFKDWFWNTTYSCLHKMGRHITFAADQVYYSHIWEGDNLFMNDLKFYEDTITEEASKGNF